MNSTDRYFFGGNREKAILRDGEKCIKCGMSRVEHVRVYKRDITVDHIDHNGKSKPVNEKNNEMSNLQTLCLGCHGRKDNQCKKLSDRQIIDIRHMGEELLHREIAALYGVTRACITMIIRGNIAKHLPPYNGGTK